MSGTLAAPPYLPRSIESGSHRIALVGCGWISEAQLRAYRVAGFPVTMLCDRTLSKAQGRRDEFFPNAKATTSFDEVLRDPSIDIVDIATHLDGRPALVEQALRAGKHVLSQKPFARELAEGRSLIDTSHAVDRILAVNHNGRWAPHFSAALTSVERGDIGEVTSADFQVYWPHDLEFENDPKVSSMPDLILYDFGIHWFDLIAQLLAGAGEPLRVFASLGTRPDQAIAVPTQAEVIIEYERARATIVLRASSRFSERGSYRIDGTKGVIEHHGSSLGGSSVRFDTNAGSLDLTLDGDWWSRGMTGTMAELIHAIDNGELPRNSASSSLAGLALCFAALWSAQSGLPVDPRTVSRSPFAHD